MKFRGWYRVPLFSRARGGERKTLGYRVRSVNRFALRLVGMRRRRPPPLPDWSLSDEMMRFLDEH